MGRLRMIYVADDNKPLPEVDLAPGFALRTFRKEELAEYNALRLTGDFLAWDEAEYNKEMAHLLPGGHLVITETATGRIAASASAELPAPPQYHGFGLLGWVMCHPDFRGKRLGYAVCMAVMRILYSHGYRTFILATSDDRVPAVKTYLNMGWQPWLEEPEMEELWRNLAGVFKCSYESFRPLPGHFQPPRKLD